MAGSDGLPGDMAGDISSGNMTGGDGPSPDMTARRPCAATLRPVSLRRDAAADVSPAPALACGDVRPRDPGV
jgi:hypothetical protein